MKFIRLFFLTCIFPFSLSHGQSVKDTVTFRVMSYNVENLFDCQHERYNADPIGFITSSNPNVKISISDGQGNPAKGPKNMPLSVRKLFA